MKYSSALLTEGRNKLGDTVWARNPSGNYIRARVKPTNPQTDAQQAIRNNFSINTKSWRTLTAKQIAGWNALAATVVDHDKLGQEIRPSGLQLFMRCNNNLALIKVDLIQDPPASTSAPAIGPMSIVSVVNEGSGKGIVTIDAAGSDEEQALYPICYTTAGFSTGITFVPPHFFRYNYFIGPNPDNSQVEIGLGYAVENPCPSVGDKFAVGYRVVNITTGFASRMLFLTAIFPEVSARGKVHRSHLIRRTR